mmetsp:Transcript_21587/g.10074  ORF Transcript_21587/g.10074 Transcript_21587/m.10074 type:complete len:89 (-) Transcript_21587:742-1008(-)
MNGYGELIYGTGKVFRGYSVDSNYEGIGVMVMANGDRYEGKFSNDKMDGEGKMFKISSKKVVYGKWSADTLSTTYLTVDLTEEEVNAV